MQKIKNRKLVTVKDPKLTKVKNNHLVNDSAFSTVAVSKEDKGRLIKLAKLNGKNIKEYLKELIDRECKAKGI